MTRLLVFAAALVLVALPALGSDIGQPPDYMMPKPVPQVPEPSAALLFAAGAAITAVGLRLRGRK